MVGTYMYGEVSSGRTPYVTRDPICNGTQQRLPLSPSI